MTSRWAERALSRIIDALEREILTMPDEEIAAVLDELGLRPAMRFSAAGGYLLRHTPAPEDGKENRGPDNDEEGAPGSRGAGRGDASTRH
jgi:hypothetical protein